MKILALSDTIVSYIHSPLVRTLYQDVDMVVGCGDLPYFYLEYVLNALDAPLFFVRGNHDKVVEYSDERQRTAPAGGVELHLRAVRYKGLLLAGVEGSLRYRPGPFQYSQEEMWSHVLRLTPRLLLNRLRYGRALDVFASHAPPRGIHDKDDLPHQGIQAFTWLIRVFQPQVFLHGHIHLYRTDAESETKIGACRVINAYGARLVEVSAHERKGAGTPRGVRSRRKDHEF